MPLRRDQGATLAELARRYHVGKSTISRLGMIDEAANDEAREIYAHFGLAFYYSNVLEHGIANAIFVLELLDKRREITTGQEWETLVDDHFDASFAQTLGRLKNAVVRHSERSSVLAGLMADLDKCVEERNFLAHHFWREYAVQWVTADGREAMIERLEGARDLFSATDRKLEAATQPFADRHGLTADVQRHVFELIKRKTAEATRHRGLKS
jgi:hypothetical protein